MNKAEYQTYLASREWALLREQVRKRGGGRCERCFVGNHDQTHHLTYERVGHERLEDLQAVCAPCHEFLSGKSDFDPAAVTSKIASIFRTDYGEMVEEGLQAICPKCGLSAGGIRCVTTHGLREEDANAPAFAVRFDGMCGHTWDLLFWQHERAVYISSEVLTTEHVI